MRVLVFGASTTQGFWDTEGGWVQRLRSHYDNLQVKDFRKDQPWVINLGISGETIGDTLKRFPSETETRLNETKECALIFSLGGNDANMNGGKPRSTPDTFRSNLERLISEARRFSDKILFVGLTPVDEKLTTPLPWADTHVTNSRRFIFENVMRDECIKHQIPHVAVLEPLQDEIIEGRQLLANGLHPNNEGHKLIFQLVRPVLDEVLST